jgi:signal peptidase II
MPDSPVPDGDTPAGSSPPSTHRVLFGIVLVGWLLVDQLTKTWALNSLTGRDIDIVGSLRFNLAYNTGTAFSLGGGLGPWIAVLALVVVGVLVWQGRSVRTRLGAVALAMIVGGALGNVLDRAFRSGLGGERGFMQGAVVDFIDLQWWPIFNVADIGIVVGGILLVISSFRSPADDPDPDPAPGDVGAGAGADAVSDAEDGPPDRAGA